jgi:5-methylcytosine-specific restriction endonuclease McrA
VEAMLRVKAKANAGRPKAPASKAQKDEFYKSWEWRTLRIKVLNEFGARCMCCGSTPEHKDMNGKPVKIVVDHIKSLHKHWHLRLKRDNLQVLCDECNQGKAAWDETVVTGYRCSECGRTKSK